MTDRSKTGLLRPEYFKCVTSTNPDCFHWHACRAGYLALLCGVALGTRLPKQGWVAPHT